MFENAKWISKNTDHCGEYSEKEQNEMSILARYEFSVSKPVISVQLYICALGLGVYTVNGVNVTDEVLCTPYTAYDKRIIYQKYNITDIINDGKNAIGVHLGNGFYNDNMTIWGNSCASWRDRAKLVAEISVKYADGTSESIVSNSSWKVCYGPCIYNRPRQGEIYDFCRAQKGFDMPGFDDSAWEKAIVVNSPGGVMEPMKMPPIRVIRTVKPVSFKKGIYDFGENMSGWVRIKASGKKGQEMIVKYDEWLSENGEFFGHIDNFNKQKDHKLSHENRIIFSGDKTEEYAPSFCYHGFRYVKLTNAPEDVEITAEVVHTDLERTASFTCDDEMLCKIHEASVRSTLSNYHGIPTDCPHREQNGWTGDAHLSCEQALKNFDMISAYTKWLHDFKDVQRPTGQLPGIVPTSNWGYNNWNGPAWDSALILIPLCMYEQTGNTDIINDMWENIEKYMDYLFTISEDYIIDYGLGDWCALPTTDVCPASLTSTAYYYYDALCCKKMASLTGRDTIKWEKLSQNIRKAWRDKFMSDKDNYKRQTFFACAIYQRLLDDEETKVFAKKLAELVENNGYHIDCGILGAKYIFSALSENGYADVVYKMVTEPTMPSYAYWINRGMTTLAESWDMIDSQNHHMFSEVDNWLYKYVGGFDFSNGQVVVKPFVINGINHTKVVWRDVEIERNKNVFTIRTGRKIKLVLNGEERIIENGSYRCNLS